MLTYPLEQRGAAPLYEYLCRCIRRDILSGALPPGSRLPSKRALAAHLNVSAATVETAYGQLEAEGYLIARPRQGFFAAAQALPPPPEREPEPCPEPPVRRWRLDLGRNRVGEECLPAAAWARISRQVLSQGREALLAPVPHQGLWDLRQAIAGYLRSFKGMAVHPGQIVIGAGAEYLYLMLAQLMGREAVFAVEDPGYPKIAQVYRAWGARCVPVPLDGQGADIPALERSGANVLHISPGHQYPSGIITSLRRRRQLLGWAEGREGYIVEDDYDSDLRREGRPLPPLQSIDTRGRVMYLSTFSQTVFPALRLGFLVLPAALLERWRQRLGFYACPVPVLEQQVLARFISQGYYERHLRRLGTMYRHRRQAVMEAFRQSPLAPRVRFSEEGAGLHFLLRLDTQRPDGALRQAAEAAGIRLSFLGDYAAAFREEFAHTLVVHYGALSPGDLPEALALMSRTLLPLL